MTPRETAANISQPKNVPLFSMNEESNEELDEDPKSPTTQNTEDDHPDDAMQVLPSTSNASLSKRPREDQNPFSQTKQFEFSNKKQLFSVKKQKILPAKQAKGGNDVQKRMLALEEEKLKWFKQRKVETDTHRDYDYHFLMSLLPHFKNVKQERKLLVQLKLQQVLLDEVSSYKNQLPEHVTFPNRCSMAQDAVYSTNTTPQSALSPSPASTQSSLYELSSSSVFSPPSESQHPNSSTNQKPVPESETPEEEQQAYDIAALITNFRA